MAGRARAPSFSKLQTRSEAGNSVAQQQEVVEAVVVLENLLLDGRTLCPGNEVLHVARDQHRRVRHHVGADPNVALLDEGGCLPQRLAHLEPDHHDGQSPPAKTARRQLVALTQPDFGSDDAQVETVGSKTRTHNRSDTLACRGVHRVSQIPNARMSGFVNRQLLQEPLRDFDPVGIVLVKLREHRHHLVDPAHHRVVLDVVLAALDVVTPKDLDLTEVALGLPVQEVNLCELTQRDGSPETST